MSNHDMSKLPADIAAAIDALEQWHDDALRGYGGGIYGEIRAALDATILKHLAELRGSHECVEQHLEDVCAENERLRDALQQARDLIYEHLEAPYHLTIIDAALARPAAAESEK